MSPKVFAFVSICKIPIVGPETNNTQFVFGGERSLLRIWNTSEQQPTTCTMAHKVACVKEGGGGWGEECKKEKKGTPAAAFRPLFQLSQLSLQRPIRIRPHAFLHDWLHEGMNRQSRFRSCRAWAWENLRNRMSAPRLQQKFVKGDGNPM